MINSVDGDAILDLAVFTVDACKNKDSTEYFSYLGGEGHGFPGSQI